MLAMPSAHRIGPVLLIAGALTGCGGGATTGADGGDAAAGPSDGGHGDDDGSPGGLDGGVTWWQPAPGTSWQWQLTGTIDTSLDVVMYDVDLFDAPDDVLTRLRADQRIVICYFSAGSHEDWRPDAADFPAAAI